MIAGLSPDVVEDNKGIDQKNLTFLPEGTVIGILVPVIGTSEVTLP